jgi:hypothetical protein
MECNQEADCAKEHHRDQIRICSRCDDAIPRHLQRLESMILGFCRRLKFACEQVFHDTILIASADLMRTYMMKATVSVPYVTASPPWIVEEQQRMLHREGRHRAGAWVFLFRADRNDLLARMVCPR